MDFEARLDTIVRILFLRENAKVANVDVCS